MNEEDPAGPQANAPMLIELMAGTKEIGRWRKVSPVDT